MKAKALKTCVFGCNDHNNTKLSLKEGEEVDLSGVPLAAVKRMEDKGVIEVTEVKAEPAPKKKSAKKASKKPGRTEDKAADGATEDK